MSDGTAADVQLHPTKIANKRRKTVKANATNGAVRKERPPARIFVPFRACLSTNQSIFMLTILCVDYRSSIIHCRSICFHSTWKDQLSDNNLRGKMSSYVRSQKRLEFGFSDEAPNSCRHHLSLCMERPGFCSMGWRDSGQQGGCMGIQEGKEI